MEYTTITQGAGMEAGSLTNHVMSRSTKGQPEPEVGMGCTLLFWSDRHAGTIVAVDGKTIEVQEDHAKRTDGNGMSESQTYEFSPNPEGPVTTFTLRKNGAWVRKGEPMREGHKVVIGKRDHYHDFSF